MSFLNTQPQRFTKEQLTTIVLCFAKISLPFSRGVSEPCDNTSTPVNTEHRQPNTMKQKHSHTHEQNKQNTTEQSLSFLFNKTKARRWCHSAMLRKSALELATTGSKCNLGHSFLALGSFLGLLKIARSFKGYYNGCLKGYSESQ